MQLRIMLASLLVVGACSTNDSDKTHPGGTLVLRALDPSLGVQGQFVSTDGVTLTFSVTRDESSVNGVVKTTANLEVASFTFKADSVAVKLDGVVFDPDQLQHPTPELAAFARSPNGLALRELGRAFTVEAAEDEALAAKLKDFHQEVAVLGTVTNIGNIVAPGGIYIEQRPTDVAPYSDGCQAHAAPSAWYHQDGHEDRLSDDLRSGYWGSDVGCMGLCGSGCNCVYGTCRYTTSCWNHDYVTMNNCGGSHWTCFLLGFNNPYDPNYWNPYGGFGCAINSALGGSACGGVGKLGS